MELFLVNDELVAIQQAYSYAYFKEDYYALTNFYCPRCGTVWGRRVQPDAPAPRHLYNDRPCGSDMILPWEWNYLEVLGPNVMAYLILLKTQEVKSCNT